MDTRRLIKRIIIWPLLLMGLYTGAAPDSENAEGVPTAVAVVVLILEIVVGILVALAVWGWLGR